MKRRYIYMLLVGIPGAFVSLFVAAAALGMAMGVLWLFVFGDNTSPAWVESALPVLFVGVFLGTWLAFLIGGYIVGHRLEEQSSLNKRHVLMSAAATAACVFAILLYQAGIGNLGPNSPEANCQDFCTKRGYFASSVSPRNEQTRTCSCLDSSGQGVIVVPISQLDPAK